MVHGSWYTHYRLHVTSRWDIPHRAGILCRKEDGQIIGYGGHASAKLIDQSTPPIDTDLCSLVAEATPNTINTIWLSLPLDQRSLLQEYQDRMLQVGGEVAGFLGLGSTSACCRWVVRLCARANGNDNIMVVAQAATLGDLKIMVVAQPTTLP